MLAALLTTVIASASPGYAPSLSGAGLTLVSAEAAPARATLAIDTSSLREAGAGPAVAYRLRGRGDALLRQAAILPLGGVWDPVVAITVRPLSGLAIGYQATIAVELGGRALPEASRDLRCDLCTEGELVAQLVDALAGLLPELVSEASADRAAGAQVDERLAAAALDAR